MTATTTNDDLLQRKRALRLRIGRSRRRIDGQLRTMADNAKGLLSWRTYAVHYPAAALAVALAAGWTVSAGMKPARLSRWLAVALLRPALDGVRRRLLTELQRLWTDSTPKG